MPDTDAAAGDPATQPRLDAGRRRKAELLIERNYGVKPADLEWLPCHDQAFECTFRCPKNKMLYIGRLEPEKNTLRLFTHKRNINLH